MNAELRELDRLAKLDTTPPDERDVDAQMLAELAALRKTLATGFAGLMRATLAAAESWEPDR